jgi:outer membrane receptor for ferric coprogen and ferric-rhodotorulic acid
MVALVDERDSFTKYVFDNKRGFYGIVEADLTSTTTIGASVMYQKNKSNDHFGVPMGADGADLGLPRSSFWGVKNGDFTRESTSYTLTLDQEFSAGWLLKSAYTHADTEIDQPRSSYLSGMLDAATGNGLRVIQNGLQRKAKSDVLDIYVNGPFSLLGRQHELMVGATTTKSKDNNRTTPFTATPINIYSFDPGALPFPEGDLEPWGNPNETVQKGMYAATRLNLADPLKLIFGARASWYEYKAAGVTTQKESGVVTPYAGLIYDFDKNTSFYVSYSDIFKPQSNLKFGGGTVDPIVGKNYELGVKSEFLQGRMNASAAIFRLEQTNLAQVDQSVSLTGCDGGRCFIGAGLIVSQGVDLGFNGEILTGWQVGAGYTYVQSKYGNGVNKGEPYETWKPRHILRAHTTYRIPKTDWNVGASVRTQSRMYTEDDDLFIKQGGYTVVGLMAKYRISKQAELGITVNNLFDRRYYESIGSYGPKQENFYGAPRSFMVNMKYSF